MNMDTDRVDLAWMRAFIVLADELHFGRAATRLGMAQPQLSQQIRRLETVVGATLFLRTSRSVSLTAAGTAFRDSSTQLLRDLRRNVGEARRIGSGDQGELVIGYVAAAMLTMLPRLVRRYRAAFPGVRIELLEISSRPQLEALASGSLDVSLVTGPVPDDLISRVALREPLVAVLPSHHRLAKRRRIALGNLAAEDFVIFPRQQTPLLYAEIIDACSSAGFSPRIVQIAQTWHAIVSLVSAGMGVTIAPSSVGRFRVAGVKLIPLMGTKLDVIVNACVRQDASPAARRFLEMVEAE